MTDSKGCIFCKIISKESPAEIIYEDNNMIVIKDIKPASKIHFLAIPKQHIESVKTLTINDKPLVEALFRKGEELCNENQGNLSETLFGFHVPPFNSVQHLHLHIISPKSEMSYLNRVIFTPNTWWFNSIDQVFRRINSSNL